ncbi:N-acetyltransferase [Campylobacter ureolyticus]|uniref:N-acetyltransferase n=1 Tax=Campylobacter ureolyticus TaxID=827 RepID=A0A9Q4KQT0_9BACT|nr:N-acetyltransferase [Campylobacter ureolyticus]MCZ6103489.1 N-acetyltransferase [Campylobacter ureolyticus]MCZ6116536.1 N-acetyltransferase [Campylobacter ureolyticus]MCZ6134086.1 N-acetyltransferase [Campylobacter ureolyticus]MCZ6161825.1 N-acetyltransferase [Campylobacter ureolyticus]MCZ6170586.1 N-acetyltransferase [Campylobacter ureolyticus]
MVEYKTAKLKDIKAMQEMVADEVKKGIILPRSDSEIAQNIRSYTLALKDNKIVGYASLYIYSIELAEIRSLVVSKNLRANGIGSNLVKILLEEAKFQDIKKVFALTYADKFFKKLGFLEISKEELPDQKIWADCIKCKQFPVCNEIAVINTL